MKRRISLFLFGVAVHACTSNNEPGGTNDSLGTSSATETPSGTGTTVNETGGTGTASMSSAPGSTSAPNAATSAPTGTPTAPSASETVPVTPGSAASGGSGGLMDAPSSPAQSSDAAGGAPQPGPAASASTSSGDEPDTNVGGDGNTPSDSGAPLTGCTRELLQNATVAYFEAMAAHDTSTLPLADDVKFTENGTESELGADGLWPNAGAVKHTHSALDTDECQAVTQAVVPEGAMDIPFALRLKLVGQQIAEIETIAVRPGDYKVSGQNFDSNTDAIISAAEDVGWEMVVPEDQRATREELIGWMNKYYRMFPGGVCNVTSDCRRLENGGGNFDCDLGASCAQGEPGPDDEALSPRLILADVERGIGVGFTMFQENTDMHMFKMYAGEVHGVQAILGAADGSGWD